MGLIRVFNKTEKSVTNPETGSNPLYWDLHSFSLREIFSLKYRIWEYISRIGILGIDIISF
jgi:hypothetical protein